jgi:hypothetical protein
MFIDKNYNTCKTNLEVIGSIWMHIDSKGPPLVVGLASLAKKESHL